MFEQLRTKSRSNFQGSKNFLLDAKRLRGSHNLLVFKKYDQTINTMCRRVTSSLLLPVFSTPLTAKPPKLPSSSTPV